MMKEDRFLSTRRSLLSRLKNWDDQKSWRDFFDAYSGLIHRVALRAGLTETEAQDVVQETVLTVAKKIGQLEYDPARGSFKGWLLTITRWRIADQLRKRLPTTHRKSQDDRKTKTVERIADPAEPVLDSVWEAEWQQNLMAAALQRVKHRVSARHFQVFDLYASKGWPVQKVARTLGISTAQVYLVKHRLTGLLRTEVRRLETRSL